MNAAEAARLLSKLHHATGPVSVAGIEAAHLEALIQQGHLEDSTAEHEAEAELRALRSQLAQVQDPVRLAELRSRALALTEVVARGRGGVQVEVDGGGPYRGGHARRVALTYRGRALLADLAPRMLRVESLTLGDFEQGMQALRETFATKARRAADIATKLVGHPNVSPATLRSVAVGLSAHQASTASIVDMWHSLVRSFAATPVNLSSPDRHAAAAEALTLTPAPGAASGIFLTTYSRVMTYSNRDEEDALDAALLLATPGAPTLEQAVALGAEARGLGPRDTGEPIPFTVAGAVRLLQCGRADALGAYGRIFRMLSAAHDPTPEAERYHAAIILSLAPGHPDQVVARALELRQHLERYGAARMLGVAAHLALLPLHAPEALDLARLAAGELQKVRFDAGGPEMLSLAVKMVLQTAQLAAGREGDREESLSLTRFDGLALERLGQLGVTSSLPLIATVSTAFHRPVLDPHLDAPPLHSPGLFSGSGGYRGGRGWG